MKKIIALGIALIVLSACSNKSLYEVGQDYRKSECINNAETAEQHQACLDEKSQTYEEYEKTRQTLIKQ